MKMPLTAIVILASVTLAGAAMASNQAATSDKSHVAQTHSLHRVARRHTATACVDKAQLIYLLMTSQPLPRCVRTVGPGTYDTRPEEYIGGPYDSPMSWE
jgi:hypothetical protein